MKSLSLALRAALSLTLLPVAAHAYIPLPVTPGPDSRNGDECRAQVQAIFAGGRANAEASRYLLGCASMDTLERYSTLTKAYNRLATAKQALKAREPITPAQQWDITADHETVLKLSDGHDRDTYLMLYQDYLRYASTATSPTPTAATCTQLIAEIAASQKKQDAAVNALLAGKAKGAANDWKTSNASREESLLDLEWHQNRARAAGCSAPDMIATAAPSTTTSAMPPEIQIDAAGRLLPGGNYLNFHMGATVTALKDNGLLVYGNSIAFDDAAPHEAHINVLRNRHHQGNLQTVDIDPNYWDPVRHGWRKLERPAECNSPARYLHTATALPDGKVLMAGGLCDLPKFANDSGPYHEYAALSLWDSATRKWLAAPSLQHARIYHSASLMPDGSVLIVGGESDPGLWPPPEEQVMNSVELFSHGAVTALPPLAVARAMHTTTVLSDGTALVAGGLDAGGHALASVELWNAATGAWRSLPPLHTARYGHTATLLKDGRVLITGGVDLDGSTLLSVEIWNPAQQAWSDGPELPVALHGHAAVLLTSGQILVTGGAPAALFLKPVPWAWTLDTKTMEWNLAGNVMESNTGYLAGPITLAPRADGSATVFTGHLIMRWEPLNATLSNQSPLWHARPSATQLANDSVMWVGYQIDNPGSSPPTAHIWDPKSDTWTNAGHLNHATWLDEIKQLPSGRVIHVGLDGDKNYFCQSWQATQPEWKDCGSGKLAYPSQWRIVLDTLPDGRAFFIANRHEVLVLDETSLTWTPWQIEWNTEDIAFGAPIRSAKPFAQILDPTTGTAVEINDAAARFWSRSSDRKPPGMLWNGKSGLWDFIFLDPKISSEARRLPDGCAISMIPSALFNPSTGKVTPLVDPGFGADTGQSEMLVLRDGTVVVGGVAPGAKDIGSGFFHRKASCAGYEAATVDNYYIAGGFANDDVSPIAVAQPEANTDSWMAHTMQILKERRWLLLAIFGPILAYFLLRRSRLKRMEVGPSRALRLFIGGLGLIFLVPAIWHYVQFRQMTSARACSDNESSCTKGILKSASGDTSIPCHYVGIWSSRRLNMVRRIELKDDGTYRMEPSNVGADLPGGYTGQWAVQDQNMIWKHDQFAGSTESNKIVPQSESMFSLIESDGSKTSYELIRQVASTHCTP